MKYKEGIVLIGDTKVLDGSKSFHHENKIVSPLKGLNIAVGSAGFTQLSKEFNQKINNLLNQHLYEFRLANIKSLQGSGIDIKDVESGIIKDISLPFVYNDIYFLDDCAALTKQLADLGRIHGNNPIESLVAINTQRNGGMLYHIDCFGFKTEIPYGSIGSGTDHIGDYLKENFKPDMSLYDSVLLGTFLIKYVELLKFDKMESVGLNKNKLPQVFIIGNKESFDDYLFSNDEKNKILKEVNSRIKKIEKSMILFSNIKTKTETLISSSSKERIY